MFWLIVKFSSCLLTGFAIKITDDLLDKELDIRLGKKTWCQEAGNGAFVYGMIALLGAVFIDAPLASSLFLAAYIVGMLSEPFKKQSLLIPAWLEILLLAIFSFMFLGWHEFLGSLTVILSVDILDDLIDNNKTWPSFLKLERLIVFLICLASSFLLSWRKLFLVYAAVPIIIYSLESRWNK